MSASFLYLINETYTQDTIGQFIPTETKTGIFAERISVSRNEWYSAQNAGLDADLAFETPSVNYAGQKLAEYDGKRYAIYRTYTAGGTTELYLARRGGTDG